MRKNSLMPAAVSRLLELQIQLRQAVLGGDPAEIIVAIRGDELDPAARVGIYRNHALAIVGASLQGTFPVICRLVDERFFAYAVHEYLRQRPPRSRCLVEHGADFADFLADFEPCKALPYLADVARFEWALNIAASVREAAALHPQVLTEVPTNKAAYVALRLQPSLSYVTSPWPIDAIWQANQENEVPVVDLASGGAKLEVRRVGDSVGWLRLAPATFTFRTALADGLVLAAAMAAATLQDPAFDLAAAVQNIFAEGLAVAYCLSSDQKTFQPRPEDLARKEAP
jgi:putative DNA-binding protein